MSTAITPSAHHYGETYFGWQSTIGEFGAWANLSKFRDFIRSEDNVLDFGCGGGYLLQALRCRGKLGIEVNETARQEAASRGVTTFRQAADVSEEWADLIISNHALEHTHSPLSELQALYPRLKPGGKIVFVVPSEAISKRYRPNDVNHHLYTWSPMCLGNLFTEAGFVVESSLPYIHSWPKHYRRIARLSNRMGGRWLFDFCCRVQGRLNRTCYQTRIIAYRPGNAAAPIGTAQHVQSKPCHED